MIEETAHSNGTSENAMPTIQSRTFTAPGRGSRRSTATIAGRTMAMGSSLLMIAR